MKNLLARSRITINAPAAKVWDALINPKIIKQYFFGTEAESDWKVGSPIVFKGKYKGKSYKDKGEILEIIPKKILKHTYWSSLSGTSDKPENYHNVRYKLSAGNGRTTLSVSQNNVANEKARKSFQQNWAMVLGKLKEILEKK